MNFTFLGLTFHLYGLILGLAALAAFFAIEKKAKDINFPEELIWKIGALAMIGALVGARLWHVFTDFYLYHNNLVEILFIWQGGLSILGGIVGGAIVLYVASKYYSSGRYTVWDFADLAVFGLPIAQVVGRTANWVNSELYGLPTNLPWKIFISPEDRLDGFQQFSYYHPLFLYEMVLMALYAIWLWRFHKAGKRKVSEGFFAWTYLGYYTFIRFFLDFVRIEKSTVFSSGLGVNQLALVLLFSGIVLTGFYKNYLSSVKLKTFAAVCLVAIWSAAAATILSNPNYSQKMQRDQLNTSEFAILEIAGNALEVEVADSPEELRQGLSGRSEIGADGMLFIFSRDTIPTFWMKEMKFDLDMVWIRNQVVVDITENIPAPAPDVPLSKLPHYSPDEPVDMILEIPAGKALELQIKEGSTATLVKNP